MHRITRRPSLLFLSFIFLTPWLLFWRWVFQGEVLFWGTLLLQFWPWRYLAKTIALSGEWPLWNPYLGNGAPLLANLQTAFFYPLNILYLFIPVEDGLTLSVIIHLILAGLFMYGYTRQLDLQPFAATVSSLVFMFSGYIVGRTQFIVMVNAAAWLPLLLYLSERLVTRRAWSDMLWLSLGLAVQLLAGHAQLWFYSLWLIGPYIIFRSWQQKGHSKRHLLMVALLQLAVAVVLAILLTMIQLLPTAEFTSQSPRNSGAERTFALTYSFWPWRLITLLAPNFFGHPAYDNYWGYANFWEDHAFVGVLPLLLAVVAGWNYLMRQAWGPEASAAQTPKPQLTPIWKAMPFFAALIPISLFLAMGWNTPLYLLVFDYVPGFSFFQAPARLLIWYTVAVAVLAGLGAETFKVTPAGRRGWQRLMVAALGLTVAGIAGTFGVTGRSSTFLVATATLGIWLVVSALVLLQRPRRSAGAVGLQREAMWQWVVLTLITADLVWAAWLLNPTLPAALYRQASASETWLKSQPAAYRYFVAETFDYDTKFKGYFQFTSLGPRYLEDWLPLKETLIPNLGVSPGLYAANNYDPLVVGRWQQLVALLSEADAGQAERILGLMNVAYLVDRPQSTAWPALYTYDTTAIYQVPEPLPRAYFVAHAYQAQTQAEVLARLSAADFDYQQETIIMDSDVKNGAEVGQRSRAIAVTISQETTNRVVLQVTAPTAGFVVLTDTFYPGWLATIDGQPTKIWPANLAFRAVEVTAGAHEIVFSYQPRSFSIGGWTTVVTAFIIGLTFLLIRTRP